MDQHVVRDAAAFRVERLQDAQGPFMFDAGDAAFAFARQAPDSVLLLGGGANRTQAADIVAAVARWEQYTEQQ
jgi:hypothetical protein